MKKVFAIFLKAYAVFFVTSVLVGAITGFSLSRNEVAIAALNRIQWLQDDDRVLLVHVCNGTNTHAFDIDSNELSISNIQDLDASEPFFMTHQAAISAFAGGSLGGLTLAKFNAYVLKNTRKKAVIALALSLSGYFVAYHLAGHIDEKCDSAATMAYLKNPGSWRELERRLALAQFNEQEEAAMERSRVQTDANECKGAKQKYTLRKFHLGSPTYDVTQADLLGNVSRDYFHCLHKALMRSLQTTTATISTAK